MGLEDEFERSQLRVRIQQLEMELSLAGAGKQAWVDQWDGMLRENIKLKDDIGKLEKRIQNLEYYTSLNMLESDTQSLQIQDANGLDRFKAGFIVDNFSGHRVGDTQHKDYKCSIDMESGELRPVHKTKPVKLEESVSTDTERTSAGYKGFR